MITPLRLVVCAFSLALACCASAVQPAHNYSDKTVAQLLELLESQDSTVRQCAAIFLGDRYRNPKAVAINGPIHMPNSPSPELPIPAQVVFRLAQHLQADPDLSVRMCAVFALHDLRFRTNTAPILETALNDKDVLIRIRACTALIDISEEYSPPLVKGVIPTLMQCLAPEGEVEDIWQAAYAAEQLGGKGKPLISALQRLRRHESSKVRHYAERALSKIEHAGKEKAKP